MGYQFVMSNILFITLFAIVMGHPTFAMSQSVYGEELDFDHNRLTFEIDEPFEVQEGITRSLTWDGEEDYGFARYDAENLTEVTVETRTGRFGFTSNIELIEYDNENNVVEESSLTYGTTNVELHEDTAEFEIRIDSVDDNIIGIVSPSLAVDDYIEQENLVSEDFDVDTSMRDSIQSLVSTVLQTPQEMLRLIYAYVDFSTSIPGLIGTVFNAYVLGFLSYFLIKEVWIG